jgi:hypothetical protein
MPKARSNIEQALGLLLSSIQKEWLKEADTAAFAESESVMYKCEAIMHKAKVEPIPEQLQAVSIVDCLGRDWVERHPRIGPSIQAVEVAVQLERRN